VDDQNRFVLSKKEILTLSMWACNIEKHYSKKYGKITPMDIEWAKDGITGELLLLQARPETIHRDSSEKKVFSVEEYRLEEQGTMILTGRSVGNKISNGMVRVIDSSKDLDHLKFGEVLVTDKTDPDWEPAMKRAAAIVTNRGGRTCHAAIIARELGIPAVVGCGDATLKLADESLVTVSCSEGDTGFIYDGLLETEVTQVERGLMPAIATKIMMNIGNPGLAFDFAQLPNAGVGLARLEFIINNNIGVHPKAILDYPQLDADLKKAVESGKAVTDWNSQRAKKSGGSSNTAKGKKEFADKLATVYRDSDFEGFVTDLQAGYENADFETLLEGIKSYLEAEGIKLK
jgi:pyruvate,water dikinase